MFDTIILLASDMEEPIFGPLLQSFNSALTIFLVVTAAELTALTRELLQRSRLVGFATSVIVPKPVLDQLGFGAYNFHPGPPNYPGWVPALFAVFDDAREFGVTAHRMSERVDEGEIVGTSRFPVPWGSSVTDLEGLAYDALLRLFGQLAPTLATQAGPLAARPIAWSGRKCTRRAFADICNLPLDIARDQFSEVVTTEAISRLHFTAMDFVRPPVRPGGATHSPPIAPDEPDGSHGERVRMSLGQQ